MPKTESMLVYGNCIMQSPDGVPMVRIGEERAEWYLNRNLAEVVSNDPYTIRLTFTPGGLGKAGDPYYLQKRENICVVCGTNENLSRHHCVPYCFRRYFPEQVKQHGSHDVLPLCEPCHRRYERIAEKKKLEISVCYDKQTRETSRRAFGAANSLLHWRNYIPQARRDTLYDYVRSYLGKEHIDDDDLREMTKEKPIRSIINWDETAKSITDIPSFVEMWRRHFIDTMNPQYLPPLWSIEGRINGSF